MSIYDFTDVPESVLEHQRAWDKRQAILNMRRAGMSFAAIGKVVGVCPERARGLAAIAERKNKKGMGPVYDYVMRVRGSEWTISVRRKKTLAAIERLADGRDWLMLASK